MRMTASASLPEFLSVGMTTSQFFQVVCLDHNELLKIILYILRRPLNLGEGTEADLISLPAET